MYYKKLLSFISLGIIFTTTYADNWPMAQQSFDTLENNKYNASQTTSTNYYIAQWYLTNSTIFSNKTSYGNSFRIKDKFIPANGQGVVVAVIDTGYTPNPNFSSQLIKWPGTNMSGYTFISDCRVSGACPVNQSSNTEIGYKPDALDTGNWTTADDCKIAKQIGWPCIVSDSSWHGTGMIGLIAGQGTSLSKDLQGGAYGAKILPIRLLGKFFPTVNETTDSMLWAVDRYSRIRNPTPAKIINISLMLDQRYTHAIENAIDIVNETGAIVVFGAGNESKKLPELLTTLSPKIISVAGSTSDKGLSSFSNFGNVTISAAAGEQTNWLSDAIVRNTVDSNTNFNNIYGYKAYGGTSSATALVSAAAADIISVNPRLTRNNVISILRFTSDKLVNNCHINGSGKQNINECVPSRNLNTSNAVNYAKNFNNSNEWHVNATEDLQGLTEAKLVIGKNNQEYVVGVFKTDNSYQIKVLRGSLTTIIATSTPSNIPIKDISATIDTNNQLFIAYGESGKVRLSLIDLNNPDTQSLSNTGRLQSTELPGANPHIVAKQNGGIYAAFQNPYTDNRISVVSIDENFNITDVGKSGYTELNNSDNSRGDYALAVNNFGSPYVAYINANSKVCVDGYAPDSNNWFRVSNNRPIQLNNQSYTNDAIGNDFVKAISLAFDKNNLPYLAYTGASGNLKVIFLQKNQTKWANVGPSEYVSNNPAMFPSLNLTQQGDFTSVSVAFKDINNNGLNANGIFYEFTPKGWQTQDNFTNYDHTISEPTLHPQLIGIDAKNGKNQYILYISKERSLAGYSEVILMKRRIDAVK